jgi:hypothetical protein
MFPEKEIKEWKLVLLRKFQNLRFNHLCFTCKMLKLNKALVFLAFGV